MSQRDTPEKRKRRDALRADLETAIDAVMSKYGIEFNCADTDIAFNLASDIEMPDK